MSGKNNKCYSCKSSRVKLIRDVCCDCNVDLCTDCINDERSCGCFGKCTDCKKDVNRGENGWPCDACKKWLCDNCKDNNECNYCK